MIFEVLIIWLVSIIIFYIVSLYARFRYSYLIGPVTFSILTYIVYIFSDTLAVASAILLQLILVICLIYAIFSRPKPISRKIRNDVQKSSNPSVKYYRDYEDDSYYYAEIDTGYYFTYSLGDDDWKFVDKYKDINKWDRCDRCIFLRHKSIGIDENRLINAGIKTMDLKWARDEIKYSSKKKVNEFMDDLSDYLPDSVKYYRFIKDNNSYYAEYDTRIFVYRMQDRQWTFNGNEDVTNSIMDYLHLNRTRSKKQLMKDKNPLIEVATSIDLRNNKIPRLSEAKVKRIIRKKTGFLIDNLIKKYKN